MIDWLREPGNRVHASWALLLFCLVAWPATALTIFRDEQQGILGLSWFSVIQSCVILIATTDVRKKEEERDG